MAAGIVPEKIVFSGVGKTDDEMAAGLEAGIRQFNVESLAELDQLAAVADRLGKTAQVALRVNPDVDAGTHEKISTGKAENKFGIAWEDAEAAYAHAAGLAGLEPCAIDIHIGSQITDLGPFRTAFEKTADLLARLRAKDLTITRLDLGGGLGCPISAIMKPARPAWLMRASLRKISPIAAARSFWNRVGSLPPMPVFWSPASSAPNRVRPKIS